MSDQNVAAAQFLRHLTASWTEGDGSNFDSDLAELGKLVSSTSGGANGVALRKRLMADKNVWEEAWKFVQIAGSINEAHRESEQFTRIFRGILLLLRNLVVELPSDSEEIFEPLLAWAAQYRFPDAIVSSSFYLPTVSAFVELLVNSCRSKITHASNVVSLLDSFFENHWQALCSLRHPAIILLQRVIVDSSATLDETNINVLLRDIFENGNHIMKYLLESFSVLSVTATEELPSLDEACIAISEQLLSHESFEKYLMRQTLVQKVAWLKIAQIVIPHKMDWNNFQIIAMLSWSFECLKDCANGVDDAFKVGVTADYESMMICTLDILSELAKFEQGTKFLIHYDALDLLVKVFGALQLHTKPLTIKDRAHAMDGPGSFPHAKSMIVEIVSCICHGNYNQQEHLRKIHGLELVLSNCIIDDNNPFLRERCIVCIKLLLAENPENQKFVAGLEAKGVADDKVLDEAGYEVEVVDGKVEVKKRLEPNDHNNDGK